MKHFPDTWYQSLIRYTCDRSITSNFFTRITFVGQSPSPQYRNSLTPWFDFRMSVSQLLGTNTLPYKEVWGSAYFMMALSCHVTGIMWVLTGVTAPTVSFQDSLFRIVLFTVVKLASINSDPHRVAEVFNLLL